MLFLGCLCATALKNGVRTQIQLTAGQSAVYSLPLGARDTLRWFVEGDQSVEVLVCQTEDAQSPRFVSHGGETQYTYIEDTQGKILFSGTSVYFSVSAPAAQTVWLTAQAAVELYPWTEFISGAQLDAKFKVNTRLFDYFIAVDSDLHIVFKGPTEATLQAVFRPFDPELSQMSEEEVAITFAAGTTEYSISQEAVLRGRVGYLFLSVTTTQDYSISIHPGGDVPQLGMDQTHKVVYAAGLVEQRSNAQILVNTKTVQNVTVAGFTAQQKLDGLIDIQLSTVTFPGEKYELSGAFGFVESIDSSVGAVVLDKNVTDPSKYGRCDTATPTSCFLNVLFSFQTAHYLISKQKIHYQFRLITTAALTDAEVVEKIPGTIAFDILETALEKTVVINEFAPSVGIQSTGTRGYAFSFTKTTPTADVRGVVAPQELPNSAGISFNKASATTLQAAVTSETPALYIQDAMYFARFQSDQKARGTLRTAATYELKKGEVVTVNTVGLNDPAYFYTKTTNFVQKKMMVCLKMSQADFPALESTSFSLYSSSVFYLPYEGKDFEKVEARSSAYWEGKTVRYCVYHQQAQGALSFFSLVNNGFDMNVPYNAELEIGEPFFFAQQVATSAETEVTLTDLSNIVKLKMPLHLSTKETMLQRKVYFHILYEPNFPEHQLYITQPGGSTRFPLWQRGVSSGVSLINAEASLPVDRILLLQINSATNLQGKKVRVFFQYIYDQPVAFAALVTQSHPLLLKAEVRDYQEPIIHFTAGNCSLSDMQVVVCPSRPRVSLSDQVEGCVGRALTGEKYDSLVLMNDIALTEPGMQLGFGAYYVSVLPVKEGGQSCQISFSLVHGFPLVNDARTPIRIVGDPVLEERGIVNQAYVAMDILTYVTSTDGNGYLGLNFYAPAETICLSYDKPLSYGEFESNKSRCFALKSNVSQISTPIVVNGYRRIFANVLAGIDFLQNTHVVFVGSYAPLFQNGEFKYKFTEASLTRAREDIVVAIVQAIQTKYLEIRNRWDASPAEQKKDLEAGRDSGTELRVSTDPEFLSFVSDRTKAIQTARIELSISETSQLVYVRIQKTQEYAKGRSFVISTQDITKIDTYELSFQKPYQAANLKAMDFQFKAISTPVQFQVELCRASGALSIMSSPFTTAVKQGNEGVDRVEFDAEMGYYQLQLPQAMQAAYRYQNLNYFIRIEGKNNFDFAVAITSGSSRPAVPQEKPRIIKDGAKLTAEFKGVGLQQFIGYDALVEIGFQSDKKYNNSISYKIFAVDETLPNAVLTTVCGLDRAGTPASGWIQMEFVQDADISIEIDYPEMTTNTSFIIAARNDVTGMTSVYPATRYEVAKATVSVTAIVCGAVFGTLGLGAVIFGIVWIIRLKRKERRVYEGLEEGM